MFYSRFFLEQRIKEEKFRTYRTGSPFSMVFFNPLGLVSGGYKIKKKAIDWIVKLLDQETRETDIKGWWNGSTFAVLLLDMSRENALLFTEKLVSKIQGNDYGNIELIRKSPFKIITLPKTDSFKMEGEDNEDTKRGKRSEVLKTDSDQNGQELDSAIDLVGSDLIDINGAKMYQKLIKRSLDIVLSVASLIILSPLFLLCALLIKLDSSGPVLYKQTRVGKDGKYFTFLKFRSMYTNVDEQIHKKHVENLMSGIAGLSYNGRFGESSYKLTDEGRATRFGRFLRRASIDELPQLINVLKGDMTFIGPRPHPVYEVEQYSLWHSHRLDVKPGITGLGQVYGRFNTDYEDVYRMDLRYLKKKNFFLDLKILLKTIPAVLSRRGAR